MGALFAAFNYGRSVGRPFSVKVKLGDGGLVEGTVVECCPSFMGVAVSNSEVVFIREEQVRCVAVVLGS